MPCPSMHGLVTVTSKLGEEAPPALAWLPGPGSTLDSKREAGCAAAARAGVEMSRSWNAWLLAPKSGSGGGTAGAVGGGGIAAAACSDACHRGETRGGRRGERAVWSGACVAAKAADGPAGGGRGAREGRQTPRPQPLAARQRQSTWSERARRSPAHRRRGCSRRA
eukprot:scaffold77581_cov60-Phaeocystis_antarctica.AAC.4